MREKTFPAAPHILRIERKNGANPKCAIDCPLQLRLY